MSTDIRSQIADTLSMVLDHAVSAEENFDFKNAGVDSVKMLDIVMALEETFNIRIAPQQLASLSSLDNTEVLVESLIQK